MLIDAWTGLRWSELRAVRVRDFVEVPLPILVVQRAEPEGVEIKGTKSGRRDGSRLPTASCRSCAHSPPVAMPTTVYSSPRPATSCTPRRSSGHSPGPTLAEGRRIHDLRHTAACLWLARGVDPVTVQAWMGHASIATTNLYLHHLGTAADRAGLDCLNAREHTGGTRERGAEESQA